MVSALFRITAVTLAVLGVLTQFGCGSDFHAPAQPTTWVTDRPNVLTPDTWHRLDEQLELYQKRTGHHVLVWIDKRLPKRVPIEAFAQITFNTWGTGRAGKDDGVVLFVFPEDRIARIQVGYGLEHVLPDRECVRIGREIIAPQMAAGHPDKAISDGVAAILDAIEAGEKP